MVIKLTSVLSVDTYITLYPQSYRLIMNDCNYLSILGVQDPSVSYRIHPDKAWQVYFKLVEANKKARH